MSKNANESHEDSLNIHQRIASFFANVLGSPYTIYAFGLIAFISLPATIASHSIPLLIAWITQTFIQLVALAVLQAKQVLDGKHSEKIADETHTNALLAEQNAEEIKAMLEQVYEHLFDIKASSEKTNSHMQSLKSIQKKAVRILKDEAVKDAPEKKK